MGRESLAYDEGMLFIYDEDIQPAFWMKNMNFPIDILFIGEDRLIRHIESNVLPCLPEAPKCPRVFPPVPVRYVLEVQAGQQLKS